MNKNQVNGTAKEAFMQQPNGHRPDHQRDPETDVPPKPSQPIPNRENPDLPGTTPSDPGNPGQGQPIPPEMTATALSLRPMGAP